jgi:N-acetylmuramic acid 6-phosphate etherase
MPETMDTEQQLLRYRDASSWPAEESLAAMLNNQCGAFAAVRAALPSLAGAAVAAARRLGDRGRLIYVGAGSSGRLAVQDGVELRPTFGWPAERIAYVIAGGEEALVRSAEGAEDDAAAGMHAMAGLAPGNADVVVSVAASGTTPFTRAAQAEARRAAALTIAFANNDGSPLLAEADHPVLLQTGPEFLAGSTRMTAGTAQKIALNLLSTQIMTELGRVYRGLMVDMIPSNAKLEVRAQRMVATLAGVPLADAASAWEAAGRNVKLALLMLDGMSRTDAETRLRDAGGRLDRLR